MHPHGRFDFSAFSRKLRIIAQQLEDALQVSVISIRLLLAEYPAPFPITRSDVYCGLARQPINHTDYSAALCMERRISSIVSSPTPLPRPSSTSFCI